jgi:hypothetical protein
MFKKVKIVFFTCLFSMLYAEIELKSGESPTDAPIESQIDTYRMCLKRLSSIIKKMSENEKQFISPTLIEVDTLFRDAERIKKLQKTDLVSTQLNKVENKLKNHIHFIENFCKEFQAKKMVKSPGERNVFEEKSTSRAQKIEDDQIQYAPTIETVQHMPNDKILNEESGRP